MIYLDKSSNRLSMTCLNPYEHDGWNTGNSRNGAYYRKVDTQFGQI